MRTGPWGSGPSQAVTAARARAGAATVGASDSCKTAAMQSGCPISRAACGATARQRPGTPRRVGSGVDERQVLAGAGEHEDALNGGRPLDQGDREAVLAGLRVDIS